MAEDYIHPSKQLKPSRAQELGRPTRGRKGILTDELIEKIAQLVQIGNYVNVACAAVGINPGTYHTWARVGVALMEKYPEVDPAEIEQVLIDHNHTHYEIMCVRFTQRIKRAEAEGEAYLIGLVRQQAPKHWQAAMTILERRHPRRWRRRVSVDDNVDDDQDSLEERAMLEDPEAVKLLHEALKSEAIESTAVEIADESAKQLERAQEPQTREHGSHARERGES